MCVVPAGETRAVRNNISFFRFFHYVTYYQFFNNTFWQQRRAALSSPSPAHRTFFSRCARGGLVVVYFERRRRRFTRIATTRARRPSWSGETVFPRPSVRRVPSSRRRVCHNSQVICRVPTNADRVRVLLLLLLRGGHKRSARESLGRTPVCAAYLPVAEEWARRLLAGAVRVVRRGNDFACTSTG